MDTDSSYEEAEAEGGSSTAMARTTTAPSLPLDESDRTGPHRSLSRASKSGLEIARESREQRWERLRDDYNDQYLNTLNEAIADRTELAHTDLDTTQLGCVTWSALEKEKFFCALSRKSKADLRGVASSIGSKTDLEVYDYLRLLEEEDRNQQLYATQVSIVANTDIPAAAEISGECEALLEDAADALAVYQQRFDRTQGEHSHQELWLIDSQKAAWVDKLVDDAEDGDSEGDGSPVDCPFPASSLFRLSSWVSLTERVFMKSTLPGGEKNALDHAAEDEAPAITQAAIAHFHGLALRTLRQLIQTSIFCAESRLRRIQKRGHNAQALVKHQDIATAIDLLHMKKDWIQFWVDLARRNQLQVVDGRRRKGGGGDIPLEYDEVERRLSKIPLKRQRHRSASSASRSLSHFETSTNLDDGDSDISRETYAPTPDRSTKHQSSGRDAERRDVSSRSAHQVLPTEASPASDKDSSDSIGSNEDLSGADNDTDDDDDADEDHDLEDFDQAVSQRAELQLYRDLGWTVPTGSILGDEEAFKAVIEKPRPVRCKPREELWEWRDSIRGYTESWEEHGALIDEATFMENQRSQKRRKIQSDTPHPQSLALRTSRP